MCSIARARLHTHRTSHGSPGAAQEALFPWQMSAPESIWNYFSNEDLGQEWGRAPPGQNVLVSTCVRGHRQSAHLFIVQYHCVHWHIAIFTFGWCLSVWMTQKCLISWLRFLEFAKAFTIHSCHLQLNIEQNGLVNIVISVDKSHLRLLLMPDLSVTFCGKKRPIITFENDRLWPGNDV